MTMMMMTIPGRKLAHPHPLPRYLSPKRRHLGAAIYCVYKGPRSKQKGSTTKKKKNVTPKKPNEAGTHPIAELPLGPLGDARLVPKKTTARTYMSPHST